MSSRTLDVDSSTTDSNGGVRVAASKWEVWGWYMYDVGCSAFSGVALPIFFPLLLATLATQEAYRQSGQSMPPTCGAGVDVNCLQCVPGQGLALATASGYEKYAQPKVYAGSLGIDPVAYTTIMLGISVILEVVAFISCGPLTDYGGGRMKLLIAGTFLGAVPCVLCLAVSSPSVWWLAGVLLLVANVGYGLAIISYYSYLALLVDLSSDVLEAEAACLPKPALMAVREQVENTISLTGVGIASIASILATGFAFVLTLASSDEQLRLRLGTFLMGLWWIGFSLITFKWLGAHPGPPLPSGGVGIFAGWQQLAVVFTEARQYKNALYFLLCYFIYADGYTTLTQIGVLYGQRELCMGTTALLLLVICVLLFGAIGSVAGFWIQRVTNLGNKSMVLLLLGLMVLLPLWGLLGYATPSGSFGLKNEWELYVFCAVFGLLLGPMLSFSRTLFIDMIPPGREGAFFSLFAISDKGSSWLGPFIVAVLVQATGELRPSFFYILGVMVVPVFLLHFLVNHAQGIADAGRLHLADDTISTSGSVEPSRDAGIAGPTDKNLQRSSYSPMSSP